MKTTKVLGIMGRFLLAGLLVVGHLIMCIIGLIICAITMGGK